MLSHRRCVVLALNLLWKLSYARVFWLFSSNGVVFSVCGFSHSSLQMCVWSVDTCHKAHALSIFTTLGTAVLSSLHSGVVSVAKLTFYVSSPFWLWLTQYYCLQPSKVWTSLDSTVSRVFQVCEYPDSTISKVLDDPDIFHRTDKLINKENDKLPRRLFQFTYRNVRYSYSQIGLLEEVDENLQSTFKNRRKPILVAFIW